MFRGLIQTLEIKRMKRYKCSVCFRKKSFTAKLSSIEINMNVLCFEFTVCIINKSLPHPIQNLEINRQRCYNYFMVKNKIFIHKYASFSLFFDRIPQNCSSKKEFHWQLICDVCSQFKSEIYCVFHFFSIEKEISFLLKNFKIKTGY